MTSKLQAAPLKIAFAGTPPFAASSLQALLASPKLGNVCGVLTAPDRRSGRGRKVQYSAVKLCAVEHGLPILQPERLDAATVDQVRLWQPDLLVVAAYGSILPPALLLVPRYGCVNIHASILPRWRGAAPIERCIEAGDDSTGVTIMKMDEGCDTGPILRIEPFSLFPPGAHTLGSVTDALASVGAAALAKTLWQLQQSASGMKAAMEALARPQDSSLATYAKKVAR